MEHQASSPKCVRNFQNSHSFQKNPGNPLQRQPQSRSLGTWVPTKVGTFCLLSAHTNCFRRNRDMLIPSDTTRIGYQ
ncbi:hypothetical protein KC19_3G037300 [Ceratodon purpureus]|uniref:Uncharacterized protein n=1 Tax=Ceratodon purpureus TaxID=3225 RepID=A0A8T0IGK3_CERPU|nr:hypothetical protein KC19_3G037300 [Ceratodon purpureus]